MPEDTGGGYMFNIRPSCGGLYHNIYRCWDQADEYGWGIMPKHRLHRITGTADQYKNQYGISGKSKMSSSDSSVTLFSAKNCSACSNTSSIVLLLLLPVSSAS